MVVWRGMVKMTFTLDETTVEALKRISKRLQKTQSYVIREAICHYEPHAGQLTKAERKERVALLDRLVAATPRRPTSETDQELRELRVSRRKGWRPKS
jgi:predicted transcriptional regulator